MDVAADLGRGLNSWGFLCQNGVLPTFLVFHPDFPPENSQVAVELTSNTTESVGFLFDIWPLFWREDFRFRPETRKRNLWKNIQECPRLEPLQESRATKLDWKHLHKEKLLKLKNPARHETVSLLSFFPSCLK